MHLKNMKQEENKIKSQNVLFMFVLVLFDPRGRHANVLAIFQFFYPRHLELLIHY